MPICRTKHVLGPCICDCADRMGVLAGSLSSLIPELCRHRNTRQHRASRELCCAAIALATDLVAAWSVETVVQFSGRGLHSPPRSPLTSIPIHASVPAIVPSPTSRSIGFGVSPVSGQHDRRDRRRGQLWSLTNATGPCVGSNVITRLLSGFEGRGCVVLGRRTERVRLRSAGQSGCLTGVRVRDPSRGTNAGVQAA